MVAAFFKAGIQGAFDITGAGPGVVLIKQVLEWSEVIFFLKRIHLVCDSDKPDAPGGKP